MNRRAFLRILSLLPLAPYLPRRSVLTQAPRPLLNTGRQFVFDGVGGLFFPVNSAPTRVTISNFRRRTFLEQLFGGGQ